MKKQCKTCSKRRDPKFFDTPRSLVCQMCKIARKTTRVKVVVVKSMPELRRQAQKAFNAYIRFRDRNLGCISCGKPKVDHAGHYMSQGSSGALRFNEDNVNGQCTACNVWKRGNLIEYRIALIKKIGEERVDALEFHRHDTKKWTRDELNMIIDLYKNKLAMLQVIGDSSTMS